VPKFLSRLEERFFHLYFFSFMPEIVRLRGPPQIKFSLPFPFFPPHVPLALLLIRNCKRADVFFFFAPCTIIPSASLFFSCLGGKRSSLLLLPLLCFFFRSFYFYPSCATILLSLDKPCQPSGNLVAFFCFSIGSLPSLTSNTFLRP